jgi:hypothetical protein
MNAPRIARGTLSGRVLGATLFLLLAIALAAIAPGASRAFGTTTYKGRFVCDYGGKQVSLAWARVRLIPLGRETIYGDPYFDTYVPPAVAGTDGEWSFSVAQDSNESYEIEIGLTGAGVTVEDYFARQPVSWRTDSNYNDRPVHDYGTQVVPTAACGVWAALRDARRDYARLIGSPPPYGDLTVQYGGPNLGSPYTAYTTIVWPNDYSATNAEARHEFAHTIRNATMPEWKFLQDAHDADFRTRSSPCRRTSDRYAFHEGWAEFWAGDFAPAPLCGSGGVVSDSATEGSVAWTLTRLEHSCGAYSRRRTVQTLLDRGSTIHTLDDLTAALGRCQAAPLAPGSVPRYSVPKPTADKWSHDVQASINRQRGQITTLTKLLPGLDRSARAATCTHPPCTDAITSRIAPILARGQLAQARLVASSQQTISTKAAVDLRRPPSRNTIDLVTKVPTTLVKRTAAIGVTTMTKALAAAAPLARGDRSPSTQALLATLTRFRTGYLRSTRTGAALPAGAPNGTAPPTTETAGAQHHVAFDGLPSGVTITTQTSDAGVTFGAPSAIQFHGRPPIYVCPSGPIAEHNALVAPACPSPGGVTYFGTMAYFGKAATTASLRVGATVPIPGGLPVVLEAFDAAGELITGNAVLAGSLSNGQPAGPVVPLGVKAPNPARRISFIAIYVNTQVHDDTKLVFDDLVFTT